MTPMRIFQPDRYLLHRFIAEHAPKFNGQVLDVGGGTGRYRKLFAHTEYRILDPNPDNNPDVIGFAEHLPFPDASMDGIVCTQVLADIWEVHTAAKEIARVLKPGGLLLLADSLMNEEHNAPHDFWRFTQYTFRKLLENSFDILALEPRGGYHGVRAQNAIRYAIGKHRLYERPFLGRIAHLWASCIGRFALWRDARDTSEIGKSFTIGYCIFAKRK